MAELAESFAVHLLILSQQTESQEISTTLLKQQIERPEHHSGLLLSRLVSN